MRACCGRRTSNLDEGEQDTLNNNNNINNINININSSSSSSSRRIFGFRKKNVAINTATSLSSNVQTPSISKVSISKKMIWNHDRSDLQQLNDLDVLKKMHEHILFQLDNLTSNNLPLQNEIHMALSEVWKLEFAILKQRLRKTSIKAKSDKLRADTTRALQSLVVTTNENVSEYRDGNDFDARQTAMWLMNNFLPTSTLEDMITPPSPVMDMVSMDIDPKQSTNSINEIETVTLSPLQRFRSCARRVMVTLIIHKANLNPTISMLNTHGPLQQCLARIGEWDFNVYELDDIELCKDQCLVLSMYHMLNQLDTIRCLDISDRKLWNFLRDVEQNYNTIPYHNKFHALDVANTMYFVLKSEFMRNHVSQLDKIASLIAACVHDLGHDGYNNAYHMSSGSDIALTYNDSSVLENFHISRAFFLLKKNTNNWYQRLSRPMRNYFRNVMINLVLATDMHYHFRELTRLRAMLAAFKQENKLKIPSDDTKHEESIGSRAMTLEATSPIAEHPELSYDNEHTAYANIQLEKSKANYNLAHTAIKNEALTNIIIAEKQVETESSRVSGVEDERLFLLGAAIHICDISNPTKELKVCSEWADRIMEEFFNQGDKEKALGLPVSPMMDRETASKASGQIGFIRFIVAPIFEVFSELIPELKPCCKSMQNNLEHWENVHKQQRNERAQKRISKAKELTIPTLSSTPVASNNPHATNTSANSNSTNNPTVPNDASASENKNKIDNNNNNNNNNNMNVSGAASVNS